MDIKPQLSNAFLEISEDAIKSNIQYLKSLVPSSTKLMVMVKAFGYGHGAIEVSKFLENHQLADYLAVASIYKGIELRKAGIDLPIMITNPVEPLFNELVEYRLEPTIHHIEHLQAFLNFLKKKKFSDYPIHLKFNTGMNRFGFNEEETNEVIEQSRNSVVKIISVMSHLSSADIQAEDDFTLKQIEKFHIIKNAFESAFDSPIIFHILNSNGILRFPEYSMDMVRSGIAVFGGIDIEEGIHQLKAVSALKTKVAQIRQVDATESISYARSAIIESEKRVAVISIGYANGFPRLLSKGKWEVEINGELFPTIGNVCMDYTMIDISNSKHKIETGDSVIIFGGKKSLIEFAHAQGTISYEALTNLGNVVDRVFV